MRLVVGVALGTVVGVTTPTDVAWGKAPIVVELFTAQGCASCRQANRLIAKIADRPGVIALTWSVDYWDYLGWKDTFAQSAFTGRQKTYARRVGPRDVYTPQVVVNGAAEASGDDASDVEALIRKAEHSRRRPPRIRLLAGGRVSVGNGPAGRATADVWLVRYDPREQSVTVTAGDNRGATVVDRNVVRQFVRLGRWQGHATSYRAPAADEKGLESAVLVQDARGGPILAAADGNARKP